MIGKLKTLFSSENLIENVSNGIDKAILTQEEKLDNFNKLLELYSPFKIAQRFLALIFCIPYVICWITTFFAGFWFPNTEPMLKILNGDVGTIVITVAVFYFGGGALEGAVERFKGLKNK